MKVGTIWVGQPCKLDGKNAVVIGRRLPFGKIATSEKSVEFCWETIDRIMKKDGNFKSKRRNMGLKHDAESVLNKRLLGVRAIDGCLTYVDPESTLYMIIHEDCRIKLSVPVIKVSDLEFGWILYKLFTVEQMTGLAEVQL